MKETIPATPGRLAVSRAGRDKGRLFLVLREEPPFVYVADGALRKLEKPKKKKRMHLSLKPLVSASIAEALQDGRPIFDHEIRAAIEAFGFQVKGSGS